MVEDVVPAVHVLCVCYIICLGRLVLCVSLAYLIFTCYLEGVPTQAFQSIKGTPHYMAPEVPLDSMLVLFHAVLLKSPVMSDVKQLREWNSSRYLEYGVRISLLCLCYSCFLQHESLLTYNCRCVVVEMATGKPPYHKRGFDNVFAVSI